MRDPTLTGRGLTKELNQEMNHERYFGEHDTTNLGDLCIVIFVFYSYVETIGSRYAVFSDTDDIIINENVDRKFTFRNLKYEDCVV